MSNVQIKFRFQLTASRFSQEKEKDSVEITSLKIRRPPSNARVREKKNKRSAAAAKMHSRKGGD